MTPDAGLMAQILTALISALGTTPILVFLALVIVAPWAVTVWITRTQDRRMATVFERQDKRFEDVVQMYERNVDLVKSHERINENLQNLIILTTSTLQTLVEHIKNNLYCPLVRQKTRPARIDDERENARGERHEQS